MGLLVLAIAIGVFLFVVRPFGGGGHRSPTGPATSPSVSHEAPLDARGRPYR
jgi:hypothetical protein